MRVVDLLPRSTTVLLSPNVELDRLEIALIRDTTRSANAHLVLTLSEPQTILSLPLTTFPTFSTICSLTMCALPNDTSSLDSIEPKITIPAFIYGSAWKGENTTCLVNQALEAGFTALDTAAQTRHYREDLVGEAVRQILSQGTLRRKDLFVMYYHGSIRSTSLTTFFKLQTKYTPIDGQNLEGLPYRPEDSVADQVRSSVASSLINLRTGGADDVEVSTPAYIDCVILHSPLQTLTKTLIA